MIKNILFSFFILIILMRCASSKQEANIVKVSNVPVKINSNDKVNIKNQVSVKNTNGDVGANQKNKNKIETQVSKELNESATLVKDKNKKDSSYSNYVRIKTVYELAMDANPSMFFPHDEFETVSEYKKRVSGQVGLMKEIVQITTQKSEIKKVQRKEIAKEKELKRRAIVETLMSESSSQVEFIPNDIGRYNAEKETFPIVLHDTQYQIFVPREEARTFKANFQKVKIKGVKQLKPKYDVEIKVPKAHVRSRPNGSIIGIASNLNKFEHIQDVDEWHKINFKGQFGFTHKNNANLKLVDIANEYEFHDLVAIHPNTGSLYAMISVDKLVKAPLNLASRKYEAGEPDGPAEY